MNDGAPSPGSIDLRPIVAATAVVIGMIAAAAIAYLLLDVLLLLFIGIVVAAALQPWHVVLCRWGVPKGAAVLLIYLLLLIGLVLIALVVGPVLIEQIGTFGAEVPGTYASARTYLQASGTAPFHYLGQRLPPFARLTQDLADLAPQLYQGTLGVTTSIVKVPAYFVTVLVIGFYWTMELPRFERVVLSLLAVERRPRALTSSGTRSNPSWAASCAAKGWQWWPSGPRRPLATARSDSRTSWRSPFSPGCSRQCP